MMNWKKLSEGIWVCLCIATSLTMSAVYAIYNTDPHHWGFILGTAKDVIQGKALFTETYIQYGAGEPLLFKLLNFLRPLNYTDLGFYTAITYVMTLIILFLSLKKISSGIFAVITFTAAFLIHSYSFYPWPDYYAGFFLALGVYLVIPKSDASASMQIGFKPVSAGMCFFLSVYFRSTYLLSLFAALTGYAIIVRANHRMKNESLISSMKTFLAATLLYLGFLFAQGKLGAWYAQSIGGASSQYGIGFKALWPLLKNAFFPGEFYFPTHIFDTTLLSLRYLAVYLIAASLLKKDEDKHWAAYFPAGILVFLALLGLAGLAQAALSYEVFRLQNSELALYLVAAIFLKTRYPEFARAPDQYPKISIAILIYIAFMFTPFPYRSAFAPFIDHSPQGYMTSEIPIFRGHRFEINTVKYLQQMDHLICDGKKSIINLTRESTLAYLCENQTSGLKLPFFYPSMLNAIDHAQAEMTRLGQYKENDVIIAEGPIVADSKINLIEMGRAERPASFNWLEPLPIVVYRVEEKAKN